MFRRQVISDDAVLAQQLIKRLHAGQVRKDGSPQYEHALRVGHGAAALSWDDSVTDALLVTGMLHDVVEDTDFTAQDVAVLFGPWIADAVRTVSRYPGEGYKNFIGRVCDGSDLALVVKLADLEDNLASPQFEPLQEYLGLKHRYSSARKWVVGEINARGWLRDELV